MEVGEVSSGTLGTFERLRVRFQLNQIAGHEAGRESKTAKNLDQEPCRVAARAASPLERLFARLDARLHANQVSDLALKPSVEIDEKCDRARVMALEPAHPRAHAIADGSRPQIWR